MGKTRRTKKFAAKKRIINPHDKRIKANTAQFKQRELKARETNNVTRDLDIKEM